MGLEVIVNGKKVNCPQSIKELSTRTYQRIFAEWDIEAPIEERNYFKLFCILTDTNFAKFRETAHNEQTIWNAVKWIDYELFDLFSINELPKVLKVDGNITEIPKDVGQLSIGQNIQLRQALDKAKNFYDKDGNLKESTQLSKATAIFLQPLLDKKPFDYPRALEIEQKILDMPAYLIRPIGFFLLRAALPAGRQPASVWQKVSISLIKTCERPWQALRALVGFRHTRTLA